MPEKQTPAPRLLFLSGERFERSFLAGCTCLCLAVLPGFGCCAHAAVIAGSADAAASAPSSIEFLPRLLRFPVDVRQFAQGNALPAGNYRVDLYMNEEWKGRTSVRFVMQPGNDHVAQPCFDLELVEWLGFDLSRLDQDTRAALQRGEPVCRPLGELVEGASTRYDHGALKLDTFAPQRVLRSQLRGYVEPILWNNGITAGLLDYSYNGYRSQHVFAGSRSSHYLGLRAGFNLGAWRVRYNASAYHNDAAFHYRGNSAMLERGLPGLKSRLVVGDTATDGQVFDSVRFRGVRLDSDDRMYPDSRRGFAPVVRGIAQSNAMVSITQLGREIYRVNVPPGAFVIDDLYPTGIGGDLIVTITEADGHQHEFTIAHTGSAQLVRSGVTRYTLAAGRHERAGLLNPPLLAMGHVRRGVSNVLTAHAGVMLAEGYSALAGGLVFNLSIGALASDVIVTNTRLGVDNVYGTSLRASWVKILPGIGTQVNVASYRHSSSGYYEPGTAFALRDRAAHGRMNRSGVAAAGVHTRRNRVVINVRQHLPGHLGYFNLSVSSQDYWGKDGKDTQYQLGWNRQIRHLSLGLSASRTHHVFQQRLDNQWMLNLSMPLGRPDSRSGRMYASSNYLHSGDGSSLNTSLSGSFGQNRQFGVGAFVNADDRSHVTTGYSGGANVSWNAGKTQISANVSVDRNGYRQYGVSMNGGVVAFGGGILVSRRLGDTIAIVEAKDAGGTRFGGQGGNVRLNRRGQAIVSSLQAYRQNRISLDLRGLSTDVSLGNTSRQTVPTAGAVVLLEYETERGYSILLRGRHSNGRPLPFAAAVLDENGLTVGHIDRGGKALLHVHAARGVLTVRWGTDAMQSCQFNYRVADNKRQRTSSNTETHDFRRIEAVCQADKLISDPTGRNAQ